MTNFLIQRDGHDRLCAEVANGITVGLRIFAETDSRRLRHNTFAYAVVDFEVTLGEQTFEMRSRGIEIRWSMKNDRFYVKWPQQQFGKDRATGQPDMLDVIGPRDRMGREIFEKAILDLFHQIRTEAQEGKDFPKIEDPTQLELTFGGN